ncbi:MAG: hypothetical protein C0474_10375 [Sphingobium sp.]|nr:hypothetical protein [Sphingobium sp.]
MNIRHFGTVASVLTMIAASSSSAAQDRPASVEPAPAAATTAVPEQPTNPCEIHVWPAERFSALTTGWLSGFGIAGAVADSAGHAKGDQGRKAALASALDSEGQANALGSLDLSKSLNIKPSRIVIHNQPLDRKTVNKISTRRADSASPCYSELIVADVFYQKAALYGRSLKTLFIFRNFGTAKDKPAIYKGWGGNGLKLFPPKEGEDVQAANNELVSVFKADFEEFARNASRPKTAS